MSDYTKQDWKDGTDGGTPITAARLAHIEDGIAGHTHSASDVTSGTLSADRLPTVPVANGGTGATTAAAALTALGAASASDLASVRDSVSQIVFQGVQRVDFYRENDYIAFVFHCSDVIYVLSASSDGLELHRRNVDGSGDTKLYGA